jgi:ribose 5-phosphate isomerase RpiB
LRGHASSRDFAGFFDCGLLLRPAHHALAFAGVISVEHDNMNVLCLGARIIGPALADELIRAFVKARFTGEERHARRLAKVMAIEARG